MGVLAVPGGSSTYEEAELWLLEDEYEPIEGRVFSDN